MPGAKSKGAVSPSRDRERTVRFHYAKSPSFQTIHSDGAIGSPTPRGYLHVAFYSERLPIPTEVVNAVAEDGTLGPERARVGREGIFRELQVDVLMDLAAAVALHNWLGDKVKELADLMDKAAAAAAKASEAPHKEEGPE